MPKWQSKNLFLTNFYLRSSTVLIFSNAAYPMWYIAYRIYMYALGGLDRLFDGSDLKTYYTRFFL